MKKYSMLYANGKIIDLANNNYMDNIIHSHKNQNYSHRKIGINNNIYTLLYVINSIIFCVLQYFAIANREFNVKMLYIAAALMVYIINSVVFGLSAVPILLNLALIIVLNIVLLCSKLLDNPIHNLSKNIADSEKIQMNSDQHKVLKNILLAISIGIVVILSTILFTIISKIFSILITAGVILILLLIAMKFYQNNQNIL